jgi:hypothetical protein
MTLRWEGTRSGALAFLDCGGHAAAPEVVDDRNAINFHTANSFVNAGGAFRSNQAAEHHG